MNLRRVHIYRLIVLALAMAHFGCGAWFGMSRVYIDAAERLIPINPSSCEEMSAQVDTLQMAIIEHSLRISELTIDFIDHQERLHTAIIDKLEHTLKLDSTCLLAYLELGDYASRRMFYEDSLIDIAKRWYSLGLRYIPGNADLLTRLGFVYETEKLLDSARQFYQAVKTDSVGFLDTKLALTRLDASENLRRLFFQAPEECYLLLERMATYTREEPFVAFLRLQSSGKLETYDYYDDPWTPVHVERHLDSASVDSIVSMLQSISFLTIQNPFNGEQEWETDFWYVGQLHLPLYRITLHLPKLDHMICVYGLGRIYGRNSLADVPSVTYIHDLNIPANSIIMSRLGSLSDLWERLFSFGRLTDLIDQKFGVHNPIKSGPGTYRYIKVTNEFIRVSIPECKKQWATPRNTNQKTKQNIPMWSVAFHVGDSLYVLDGITGQLIYEIERDSLEFPYFSIYSGHIYFGKETPHGYVLRDHEFMNGKYLHTLECEGDSEIWVKTSGKKVDKYHKSSISKQFERLISFCENNRSVKSQTGGS